MERDLLGELLVPRRRDREVLEDERIACGIAQDLEEDVRVELAEAGLGLGANRLVGIVAKMEIQPRQYRARQRQRSPSRRRPDGKRRRSRENPLDDRAETGSGRRSRVAAHANPLAIAEPSGAEDVRKDLNRDASGP